MRKDIPNIASAVEQAIEREASGVVRIAYLHGSHVRGSVDEESDIDIGILAAPSLDKHARFRLRLRLMSAVADALRVPLEKIDLVILQDVPVLLQFNIIRNGIVLFERDHSERIHFELRVEQAYDDERYYLERESKATVQRILSHPTL